MENMSVELIETKEFSPATDGYDMDQVDDFLSDICDYIDTLKANNSTSSNNNENIVEISRLKAQLSSTRKELEKAQNEIAQVKLDAQDTASAKSKNVFEATAMLTNTQKVCDQTIADAKKQAAEILANAKTDAKKTIEELEKTRSVLANELKELKDSTSTFYTKMHKMLTDQLQSVDNNQKDLK